MLIKISLTAGIKRLNDLREFEIQVTNSNLMGPRHSKL